MIEELRIPNGTIQLSHSKPILSSSSRPPFVLLHGLGSSSALLSPLGQALGEKNHSVLAFDWEGCGATPFSFDGGAGGTASTALDRQLDILRAFLLFFNINEDRPCTLLGHAEGAYLALSFTEAYPEFISSLVLLCPVLPPAATRGLNKYTLYQRLAHEKSADELAKAFVRLTIPDSVPEFEDKRSWIGEAIVKNFPDSTYGFLQMCHVMASSTESSYAKLFNIRSLIIGGTHDTAAPPETCQLLAHQLEGKPAARVKDDIRTLLHFGATAMQDRRWERRSSTHFLEGGHWLPVEKPKDVAELVELFLNG
ncbi:hypothetical protein MNV49_003933 [Pseudohyphozyma bogoriensis]|nr:hypothetical protein MNV49_003933 [Pseudohyphozyma bogoriensis]